MLNSVDDEKDVYENGQKRNLDGPVLLKNN